MGNEHNNLYEFGEFRLDTKERVLFRENETIILAPKVFDTLEVLVKSDGKIVTKDDLMNEIWADSFVEEGNLTQNIYVLRQTLGKEFIETVPRRGYRFTAPVHFSSLESSSSIEVISDSDLIVATKTKTHIVEEEIEFDVPAGNLALSETKRESHLSWKNILAVSFAAVSIIGLGFFGYKTFLAQSAESSAKAIANVDFERLTDTGNVFSPVISPDGKFLAYLKSHSEGDRLHLKDMESGNDVELDIENGLVPHRLQFSPNGNHIYFRPRGRLDASGEIYKISYFGGQASLVARDAWGYFSISPDGKSIAFYRSKPTINKQSIVIKNLESGEEKDFAERTLPKDFFMNGSPAWSADGKKIAFIPIAERSNRSEIGFVDLETGLEETIKTELTYLTQIGFLPDAKNLLLIARVKVFQIFKFDYINDKSTRITNDLNLYGNISITSDGSKVVTRQHTLNSNIWLIPNAEMDQAVPLTEDSHYGLYDLAFTKTGDVIYDTRGEINRNLQIANPVNKGRITISRDENTNNRHSPTSDKNRNIYFVSDQSGSLNIWQIRPNGASLKQITFGEKGELNVAPTVSPDDEWLYFAIKSGDSNSIWRKSLSAEDKTEKVFDAKKFSIGDFMSISPDGKWLAFHYLQGTEKEVSEEDEGLMTRTFGFLNLENKNELRVLKVPADRSIIRWTNGGKAFDYMTNRNQGGKIWRQDFENKLAPPKVVFQTPESGIVHFDWSANGKDLVITKAIARGDAVMMKLAE